MNENRMNMKKGAAILFVIFALLFFVLFARFLMIQITGKADGHSLKNEALQKYLRTDVLESNRGTIYDQHGSVIAEDATSFTLAAILDPSITTNPKKPKHVKDPEKTAEVLAKYIDMDKSEIENRLKRFKKKGAFQVEFGKQGRDLSNSTKKKIEAEELPGIIFLRDSKRFYPNGKFASHLIGFTQKLEEKQGNQVIHRTIGQMGIEKAYEKYLRGKDGKIQYKSDLWGYLLQDKKQMIQEPDDGDHLYLTIDTKIQTFLEDALNDVEKEYKPGKAFALVADAKTGKILAMGQRPSFHPDTRAGLGDNWSNDLVEYSFEPGSTMKIFTLASAIEEGVFHPKETYKSGRYQVGRSAIRDHNGGAGWGTITYLEGVQRSSNVAMANLLEKMGPEVFKQYLDDFHFGKQTGIRLPNEAKGQILYNYPLEQVTTAFGQGTTVTALQLVQAATAITNDGNMMRPYIIDRIVDDKTNQAIVKNKPEKIGEPISKATAEQTREVLKTVTTAEHGTGRIYQIQGYEVAGKTGTAQMPNPDGGYLHGANNYIFSFLGMAPAKDPQLIVYAAVAQPKLEGESGSVPVSKIFNPVMRNSLQYLNIEPKQTPVAKAIKLKSFEGKAVSEVVKELKGQQVNPIVMGEGKKIIGQSPSARSTLLQGEKVILQTDGQTTMPNMENWSLRDVMKASNLAGLKVSYTGEGYVVSQNIKPGAPVKKGQKLIVKLMKQKEKILFDQQEKELQKEEGKNDAEKKEEKKET
ncbi:penicillin-binding protein [Bacillus badius]|uniref:penicillin-binding protein n=1 Tax=Bacillus badius TaxID=1455 RepID=UPI0007B0A3F6|nr:penicillin-binding protein [Bacillus badius]KZO01581.1 penicillin-binding protein [Bacillus badius]MED0667228.1 penicillin-binding protein [Bacillus badius]OCS89975.1 penicillin-binding protein [Bacillus badius]OVE53502.1 penicillin-binding protein [Bacillus badius]TDW05862.1 penicillin-binding protein 2B [Bacillus badius]